MRWVKTNAGVWVDGDAFYCVRTRTPRWNSMRPPASRNRTPAARGLPPAPPKPGPELYDCYETYPGCPVEWIGSDFDLKRAKRICRQHFDALSSPGAPMPGEGPA